MDNEDELYEEDEGDYSNNERGYRSNEGEYGPNEEDYGRKINEEEYVRNDREYVRNDREYGRNDRNYGRSEGRYGRNYEEETNLQSMLEQKDRDLMLAAELGKALLEKNSDLEKKIEQATDEYNQSVEVNMFFYIIATSTVIKQLCRMVNTHINTFVIIMSRKLRHRHKFKASIIRTGNMHTMSSIAYFITFLE